MENNPIKCQICDNSNNIQYVSTIKSVIKQNKFINLITIIGFILLAIGAFTLLICLRNYGDFLTFETTNILPTTIKFSDYLFYLIAKAITPLGFITWIFGITIKQLTPQKYITEITCICPNCGNQWTLKQTENNYIEDSKINKQSNNNFPSL